MNIVQYTIDTSAGELDKIQYLSYSNLPWGGTQQVVIFLKNI